MPPEEAHDEWPLANQVAGIHLHVILIEQAEFWSAISDLQGLVLNARSFKLGSGAMHRFDRFVRRVIRRSSGFEGLLEFIEMRLKICHCFPLSPFILRV